MSLDFLSGVLVALLFSGVEPFMQFWKKASWGTFMLSYIKFGPVVQVVMFKEKVYGQRTFKTDHNSSPRNLRIRWAKLEDLKVLKRSPDLLNNAIIGHCQLRLIIQTYFVLPYMGMVAILVKYHIYIYWILHMKFEFIQPSNFRGEMMFRYVCGSPKWVALDERS